MFNLAIIKNNDYILNNSDSLSHVKNNITEYIEFVDVDDIDDMMTKTICAIKLNPESMGETSICYEDDMYCYQIMHVIHIANQPSVNKLASTLLSNGELIYDVAVIIKTKINDDFQTESSIINIDDISQILYNKFHHMCLNLIASDNSLKLFEFTNDPVENFTPEVVSNYSWYEIPFLDMFIIVFIQIYPTNDILNHNASIICNKRIHGDVLLTLKSNSNQFFNIDQDTFKKILAIRSDTNMIFGLNPDEELIANNTQNKIRQNPFCLLKKRYNSFIQSHGNIECLATSFNLNLKSINVLFQEKIKNNLII